MTGTSDVHMSLTRFAATVHAGHAHRIWLGPLKAHAKETRTHAEWDALIESKKSAEVTYDNLRKPMHGVGLGSGRGRAPKKLVSRAHAARNHLSRVGR